VTDRRDFYHQAAVSSSRARSNCLPFAFKRHDLDGTAALRSFDAATGGKKSKDREIIGDELGPPKDDGLSFTDDIYIGFGSLYQGDHLGVEFALSSHECLLREEGLLPKEQRLLGHHPVPDSSSWQALVIDDFFCISSQEVSYDKVDSYAFKALAEAREAYERHHLEGSPEKDVIAERKFKAAGAEVDSGEICTNLGLALVSAPLAKRIGLSTLSLRAAKLPMITSKLASRLSGNWVSVLLYRRCWSSLVSDFFGMAARCERETENAAVGLPRRVAEELVCLAAVVPLISSNVATPYSCSAFASDASLASGAVVTTKLPEDVVRWLWLGADKKGHYTMLNNPFAACLKALGEEDQTEAVVREDVLCQPVKAPLLYFDFVEICGGSGVLSREAAALGLVVAPVLDLTYSEHYDLSELRFLEWVLTMVVTSRFKSFFLEPPCTTFSPAAYPSCRSYTQPLGYDRKDGKTFHGNLLAFRAFIILRVGRKRRTPSGLEQPRRSKMCWTPMWKSLLTKGFSEAVIASCQFGSIHQKEFRLLIHRLSAERLQVKCPGGHRHVPIQGAFTKPSATYVRGLARRIALEFRRTLEHTAKEDDENPVAGLESILANDALLSSTWTLLYHQEWKKKSHINVFETNMALQILKHQCQFDTETRFVGFLDSQVGLGALAKGRSSSLSLSPLCKRAAALQIVGGLYPGWNFSPTRLNPSDDPTRGVAIRRPCPMSITEARGVDFLQLHARKLPRPYANWVRLLLLLSLCHPTEGSFTDFDFSFGFSQPFGLLNFCHGALSKRHYAFPCLDLFFESSPTGYDCSGPSLSFLFAHSAWTALYSLGCSALIALGFTLAWLVLVASLANFGKDGRSSLGSFRWAFLLAFCHVATAMEPLSAAERLRASNRASTVLIPTRTVRKETRDGRERLLKNFGRWLSENHQVSLDALLQQKPADPEEICRWLVMFGQDMFLSGKTYGAFSETINAIGAARPLIRKQLAPAWDLAFAWLADEPHQHHPALPLSVLLAVLTTCLWWGWPLEAAIFALAWNGILRIGEVLMSLRRDLVLPDDSMPGVDFILLRIRAPKTRGRAAKHQAARVNPTDMVQLITAVFGELPADRPLWPYSAATLRKRFSAVLLSLGLHESTKGSRGFDLGSFRPGGATHLLLTTEDPELCRRRGRWLSTRVMEIYLQEVMATTFVQRLDHSVRSKIYERSAAFSRVLQIALSFLASGIPCRAWPQLYPQARDV